MSGRRVVVVGYPGAELLDIACVTSGLVLANAIGRLRVPYDVQLASPGGRPVECGTGLTLESQARLEGVVGPLDTVLVSGGPGHLAAAGDPVVVGHVRRLARESVRVASVCTGASVLAAAGLLDGRRATTHWRFAGDLARRHPEVTVDPAPIYVRDGNVSTAAGVTSALDLTLAFIEEDHGGSLARQVARDLVTYLQRPGNQAQMSVFTSAPPAGSDIVRRTVDHIRVNVGGALDAAALADVAGVSRRHLARVFLAELGMTPARYVRVVRLEAAAQLLVSTRLPLAAVAARCGLGSAEALRQAFVVHYGVPPSEYRARQSESLVRTG
jgi:transcriptional regulator GlxA family with amidase domain